MHAGNPRATRIDSIPMLLAASCEIGGVFDENARPDRIDSFDGAPPRHMIASTSTLPRTEKGAMQ
jgi:hypothetical protein